MILTFVGTAGSGKTTLTQAFGKYLEENDYRVSYVNLDTGVKRLPYRPDLDDIEYLTARLRLEPSTQGLLAYRMCSTLPELAPPTRVLYISAQTGEGFDDLETLAYEHRCTCGDLT